MTTVTLRRLERIALLAASSLFGIVALLAACDSREVRTDPLRAVRDGDGVTQVMWVTRFDFRTQDDVRAVIRNCADLGIDRVMFQVRGNATVFFPSPHEPWAEQLDWKSPGFDPLALAIQEAHARGMQLHAWTNVVPGWWGPTPPSSREHLWNSRPNWFWFDQHGKRQALSEKFYVSLNPALPAVREHIVKVLADLVKRYDVDGLHLDYIRFPNEPPAVPAGTDIDYPRDRESLALFASETGGDPDRHPELWDQWRTSRITLLLQEIRAAVKSAKPKLPLSAAVGPEPTRALEHFQDVEAWLAHGLLDAVYPMNYTSDAAAFEQRLAAWKERARKHPVELVMGVMIASGDREARLAQIRSARERVGAVCLFAYSALFDSPNDAIDKQDEASRAERKKRYAAFGPLLRGEGRAPAKPR